MKAMYPDLRVDLRVEVFGVRSTMSCGSAPLSVLAVSRLSRVKDGRLEHALVRVARPVGCSGVLAVLQLCLALRSCHCLYRRFLVVIGVHIHHSEIIVV